MTFSWRFNDFWSISLESVQGTYPHGLNAFIFIFFWACIKWSLVKFMGEFTRFSINLINFFQECKIDSIRESEKFNILNDNYSIGTGTTVKYLVLELAWMSSLLLGSTYFATKESVGVTTRIVIGCETVNALIKYWNEINFMLSTLFLGTILDEMLVTCCRNS